MEIVKERLFDNPYLKDGKTLKENKILGEFEIVKVIFEDCYESKKIGKRDGKFYFIEEIEVSGFNGGSRFEVTELK